jgi:hypothetical protein
MKRFFLGLPIFEAMFALVILAGALGGLLAPAILWLKR